MKHVRVILLCSVISAFAFNVDIQVALAHDNDEPQGIQVIGECERRVSPDRVSVIFAIEELKDTVKESTETANERYNQMLKAIKAMGLKNADLSTVEYTTRPHRVWENKKRRLKGYKTRIGLKVETSEVKKAGEILKTASKFGQENIQGPNPFVSKEKYQRIYKSCLEEASLDAAEKAKALAKALGVKLGKAFDVKETGQGQISASPRPYMAMADAVGGAKRAAPAKIEYGKQDISLALRVTYFVD